MLITDKSVYKKVNQMLKINEMIFENNPGLVIGVIAAKGIDNNGNVNPRTAEVTARIRERYTIENLGNEPKINSWREAYKKFGAKPKEHRSSVENLYRLVLNGRELREINKLVDIYNYISLKYMLPVGGEDLDKVKGEIELTYVADNEKPILLLGDSEPKTPKKGEIIYKDDNGAICRRFNWREAERTKLTEGTKNCVLVIEGLPPANKSDVELALNEMAELIKENCGGTCELKMFYK